MQAPTTAAGTPNAATPPIAVPCRSENKLPAATLPIEAYQAAATDPATGPAAENPVATAAT